MEQKAIELMVSHLEKQSEQIETVLEAISLQEKEASKEEFLLTLKKHVTALNKGLFDCQKVINNNNKIHKTYFEDLKQNLKIKETRIIQFDRNSRNEVLLSVVAASFIIFFFVGGFRYSKDNTDYKKAWSFLMERDLTVGERSYYDNILKNAK